LTSITALKAVRDVGKVESDEQVLVNGASSGVGMYAVQMAVARGAKVTGVCSMHNVEMVRSLGAHHVLDYTKDDFTHTSERFDVMIDIVSSRSLEESMSVLTDKGRYVMVGDMAMGKWLGVGRQARTVLKAPFVSQTLKPMLAKTNRPDLETIVKMVEEGAVWPVIDHVYPLEESSAAMRQVLGGHSRGKVVVAVAE
jgi:NADPH:quinone reductase-like Zn-dependent oxidoreductase